MVFLSLWNKAVLLLTHFLETCFSFVDHRFAKPRQSSTGTASHPSEELHCNLRTASYTSSLPLILGHSQATHRA
ncbi:hypothetical protein BDW02DRAFT_563619 [Decorospora gaudefroyi]|uniref:Secreted protein n=1 Tax=Decorospora gaudefroyi TaxID=184978 RepID=A0A6A5KXP7_9PLEO|nr:hypothetical protein BDW02DRAFT_563619 [Decorospora gaudefroyi]